MLCVWRGWQGRAGERERQLGEGEVAGIGIIGLLHVGMSREESWAAEGCWSLVEVAGDVQRRQTRQGVGGRAGWHFGARPEDETSQAKMA